MNKWFILAVLGFTAASNYADASEYDCQVIGSYCINHGQYENCGKSMIGERFTVNRKTGKIKGNTINNTRHSKFVVINQGGDDVTKNDASFQMVSASSDGFFSLYMEVDAYDKNFMLKMGSWNVVGICK